MRYKLRLVAVLLSTVMILVSCGEETIKIGVVGDFEGTSKTIVENGYKSLEMSFKDQGVMTYELVAININKGVSLDQFQTQVEENDVDLLVGPFFSSNLEKVNDVLVDNQYLTFVTTATSDILNDQEDHIYRLINSTGRASEQFTDYIHGTGHSSHLILYGETNRAYTEYLKDSFMGNLYTHGMTGTDILIDEAFDDRITQVDFSLYDNLVLFADAKTAGLTVQTIRALGYEDHIYMSGWSMNSTFLTYIADEGGGLYFFTNSYPEKLEGFEDFKMRFESEYARNVNTSATYCYEIGYFIEYLRKNASITDKEKLASYIEENPLYEGYFFNVNFDPYGSGDIKMSIMEIEDGTFVLKE